MSAESGAFWAKARPVDAAAPPKHMFAAHALDVAAVAVLLSSSATSYLPRQTLGFLVALHDVGKLSRSFQAMQPEHWPERVLGPLRAEDAGGPRHDALGFHLLEHALEDRLRAVLPARQRGVRGWTQDSRFHLFQAIAGHHGRPVRVEQTRPSALTPACIAAAGFVDAMMALFRPEPLPPPADPARLGWELAGVVTLADWVGSRQEWFPYADTAADPAWYLWKCAMPQAAAALAEAGLQGSRPAPFGGVRSLFPWITAPSPVQEWAASVPLPKGPVLAVIEDVTGSGKTEAATLLAHRLLGTGQARGVFMALPTMATANAMFDRMADAYRATFHRDAHPSLVLAHGRAALDPRFGAVMAGRPVPSRDSADPADTDSEMGRC